MNQNTVVFRHLNVGKFFWQILHHVCDTWVILPHNMEFVTIDYWDVYLPHVSHVQFPLRDLEVFRSVSC